MNLNKLCPVCQTEYLYHIQKCADCGADLLLPEEHRKAQEEKRRLGQKAVENRVVIREGDLDWMSELRAVLVDAGIPCMLHSELNWGKKGMLRRQVSAGRLIRGSRKRTAENRGIFHDT